jgi:hypothetical protein
MYVANLEAECIVFAAEGLLLAHDFIADCGIRDKPLKPLCSFITARLEATAQMVAGFLCPPGFSAEEEMIYSQNRGAKP